MHAAKSNPGRGEVAVVPEFENHVKRIVCVGLAMLLVWVMTVSLQRLCLRNLQGLGGQTNVAWITCIVMSGLLDTTCQLVQHMHEKEALA